jgi:hypothetical protein
MRETTDSAARPVRDNRPAIAVKLFGDRNAERKSTLLELFSDFSQDVWQVDFHRRFS